jgi:processive 1,2-diacylglycerol beta-glucosyltransferase
MSNARKKILILSVKAGAGHLRAAAAIEQAFHLAHPEVEARNVEALEYTNPAFQASFTGAYNKLASDLPSVWGILYEQMEQKTSTSTSRKFAALVDRLNAAPIVRMVRRYAPDAVICTHYLPPEILGPLRLKGKLAAPLFVTLTDFDIHTMWIQEGVDRYFVATDEMAHALKQSGIGSAQVSVAGIPIMPVFSQPHLAPQAMRLKLGLRPEPPTVLLSAGGFGLTRVDQTVAMLADVVDDVQLVALAGKNEKLEKSLRAVAASRPGKIVPMGFANNMHELMAASDFVVSKSGGLTSSECLAMGLPMVIFNPIPGQEERNADYLLENGVALRAHSAAHLVYKVRRLLTDSALLARMKSATRQVARPRAAFDIVETILSGI